MLQADTSDVLPPSGFVLSHHHLTASNRVDCLLLDESVIMLLAIKDRILE